GGLNIGAQLFWQQRHHPELFLKVHTILTWPQYWIYMLTGERHNDVTSLGCHTDLYDPRRQRYSTLVDRMNWHSLMPPVINSGQRIGTLSAVVAEQTGLHGGTPVFSGIHDSNASLVPHLVSQVLPFTVVSTGTWFIAMSVGGQEVELDQKKDTLLNINAFGDTVPSARFMGGRERDLLQSSMPIDATAMEALLGDSATPLLMMPSAMTGTGPYPDATQCWINPVAETNDASLSDCAVTLYLALMTYECMQLVGSLGPTFIEGPLAHDTYYAQMLAAVSDRPVFISGSETGTSVGAAMLITNPDTSPVYTRVTVPVNRRAQLRRYAALWQHHLHDHAM
nr:hypothetical protein [Granulosicoccus sp.]